MKEVMQSNSDTNRGRLNACAGKFRFAHFRFVLVILVLSFASSVHAQDKAALAWKFEKGDTFTVEFEQIQNVLTRIDARDRTLESELMLGVVWEVTDVADDGNATIEQTIERIRVKSGTPGAGVKKVVDIDTAVDARLRGVSRNVLKQVKNLIGLKFVVVMTTDGKVVSVTPDSNVATVVAELPETSALRRVFSAAAMSKLVSDSSFGLPKEAVKKGQSWNEESKIAMQANDGRAFSFDRVVKSTINAMDDDSANIDVEVTLTQAPFSGDNSGSELTSPLELTGFTGSGQIDFDRSTGTLTSSAITSEIKTLVVYREDNVKTTIKVTNRMKVVRK